MRSLLIALALAALAPGAAAQSRLPTGAANIPLPAEAPDWSASYLIRMRWCDAYFIQRPGAAEVVVSTAPRETALDRCIRDPKAFSASASATPASASSGQ